MKVMLNGTMHFGPCFIALLQRSFNELFKEQNTDLYIITV